MTSGGARYRPLFGGNGGRGGLDAKGDVIAWDHVLVGQSFIKGTVFEATMLKEGYDERMVNGASSLPYAIPNLRISAHVGEVGVSTLWWRSVASNHTGYRQRRSSIFWRMRPTPTPRPSSKASQQSTAPPARSQLSGGKG